MVANPACAWRRCRMTRLIIARHLFFPDRVASWCRRFERGASSNYVDSMLFSAPSRQQAGSKQRPEVRTSLLVFCCSLGAMLVPQLSVVALGYSSVSHFMAGTVHPQKTTQVITGCDIIELGGKNFTIPGEHVCT